MPFMRPFPVLEISTGATSQNQGQYAFSVSGVNQNQVYDVATKLMERLRPYPGFASISSDYFNNTPNLEIEIRRDQAKMYGVSETRILALLRNAYSQNYLYLIKKPEDQYQVILEAEDAARVRASGSLAALYSIRRRQKSCAAQCPGYLERIARSSGGQPSQSVHQCHALFQPQARGRRRRCHRVS